MMPRPILAATLTLWLGLAAALAAAEQSSPATPPGPNIRHVRNADGVRGVLLRLYLKTSLERAWSVVRDPTQAHKVLEHVAGVKRQPDGLWEYRLSSPLGDKLIYCKVTINEPRRQIHWKRIRGDLEHIEGFFKMRQAPDYPGYVRVDYGSYIDPGGIGRLLMTNSKRERSVNKMIAKLRRLTGER